MPVQQKDKLSFGTGRAFIQAAGSAVLVPYGNLTDFSVEFKTDQVSAFDENGFPVGVFDGHKEIALTIKHMRFDLTSLGLDFNQAAPGASTQTWAFSEQQPIATHAATLTNGATYAVGTLSLQTNLNGALVQYTPVTAGSEVAGVSYSVSGSGVIAFAAGETATTCYCTYAYTLTTGSKLTIVNTYQNSAPSYKFIFVKRDKSIIDSSVGCTAITLNSVRFGSYKTGWTDNKQVEIERSLMAFADPFGNIGDIQLTNV